MNPKFTRALRFILAMALLAGVAWEMWVLLGVAHALTIDYFDAFEYLANGRILAEHGTHPLDIPYRWRRPPVVSLLQALLYPDGGGIEAALAGFRRAHLLAWALSACGLTALFALLRREFDFTLAALGVALFAANPMFLHLVPFALVDVPAMLATTVVLATYLVARHRASVPATLLCGIALAVAMATKYNLLLIAPCLLAFEAVHALASRAPFSLRTILDRLLDRRALTIVLLGAAGWLLLHVALRLWLEGFSLDTVLHIFETFFAEFDYVGIPGVPVSDVAFQGWDDPKTEYLEELLQVTPLVLVAATAVGLFLSLRRGTVADHLHLVWLATFMLVMTFGILTKASRYLLPVLPSVIHFQLRGIAWARDNFRRRLAAHVEAPGRRALATALCASAGLVAVLWLPVSQAREQLAHFGNPIYQMTFVERLARTLYDEVPHDAPILWRGNIYSVYPENPVFFPHDEAFYFYHLAQPMLEFFLGRRIGDWEFGRPYRREDLVEVFPSGGAVVTHEDRFHLTHLADELPEKPIPLRVDVISRRTFIATGRSRLVLRDRDDPHRQIRLTRTPNGFLLPLGLADLGWHALYRTEPESSPKVVTAPFGRPPHTIELLHVERSEFSFRE